uniref:Integrase n=1 Tax=Caenorhabditis japonica TaxID=281687 RepID=A0A8R1HS57_CAEJA
MLVYHTRKSIYSEYHRFVHKIRYRGPYTDKKAETVVKAFIERWALGEGRIPDTLLTDEGKEFENSHFQQLCKMLQIKKVSTKGYNSRMNGCVERFNKTIIHIIKKRSSVPMEWDDQIPFATFAYNSVMHRTTGESPMFLMHGRDSKHPLFMEGEDAAGIVYSDCDEYKNVLTQELLKAHRLAKEHAVREWEVNKILFDKKHRTETRRFPAVGSRVLVEIPSERLGARCPKLINQWRGPYRVQSVSDNSATVIPILGAKKEILVIPFDNLRVVPNEMENVPIETIKGRKTRRKEIWEGTDCLNIQYETTHNNDYLSSSPEVFFCRCYTPCHFALSTLPELTTTSPTTLHRFSVLLKQCPHLLDDLDTVRLLALRPLPFASQSVTSDLWKALAKCPSILLTLKNTELMREFEVIYSKALNDSAGVDVFDDTKTLMILLPGVTMEMVPLGHDAFCMRNIALEAEKIPSWIRKYRCKNVLLVVPVVNDVMSAREDWVLVLNQIPNAVNVIVASAPCQSIDWTKEAEYALCVEELTRKDGGVLQIVSPRESDPEWKNASLLLVGNTEAPDNYWQFVYNAATKQGCSWPGFRIKTASESAASIGRGLKEVAGMRTQGTSAAGKMTRQVPGPRLQRHWHPRQVPPRTGTGRNAHNQPMATKYKRRKSYATESI